MDMTDDGIDMARCYPPGITANELKHGIVRYELRGQVYVSAPNWQETCASMDKARAEHRASDRAKEYAEIAAQFYGG